MNTFNCDINTPTKTALDLDAALGDIQRDLGHIKQALALLGVRPCSSCKASLKAVN